MAVETAVRTLDVLGVGDGTTVVVNGAAGAVGSAAVQIAVDRGATVIGTASPGNHDYLRSLGAEPTTYGDGLVERVRDLARDGVDAALDAAGGGALPALVELAGGPEHVVTIADYQGAEQTGATFSGGMGTGRAVHALKDIAEPIEDGRFSLPVAQTFATGADRRGAPGERGPARARQARSARRLTRRLRERRSPASPRAGGSVDSRSAGALGGARIRSERRRAFALAGVQVRLGGPGTGITGWSVRGLDPAVRDVDGLALTPAFQDAAPRRPGSASERGDRA